MSQGSAHSPDRPHTMEPSAESIGLEEPIPLKRKIGGRAPGAKAVHKLVLLSLAEQYLPSTYLEWNIVAEKYRQQCGETRARDGHVLKRYFVNKLKQGRMNKQMDSLLKDDIISRSYEVLRKIQLKEESSYMGDDIDLVDPSSHSRLSDIINDNDRDECATSRGEVTPIEEPSTTDEVQDDNCPDGYSASHLISPTASKTPIPSDSIPTTEVKQLKGASSFRSHTSLSTINSSHHTLLKSKIQNHSRNESNSIHSDEKAGLDSLLATMSAGFASLSENMLMYLHAQEIRAEREENIRRSEREECIRREDARREELREERRLQRELALEREERETRREQQREEARRADMRFQMEMLLRLSVPTVLPGQISLPSSLPLNDQTIDNPWKDKESKDN